MPVSSYNPLVQPYALLLGVPDSLTAQSPAPAPFTPAESYMHADLWLAALTFLLVAVTFWLAYETRRMRRGSDEAMREMNRHAQESSEAAIESARAAQLLAISTKALAEVGQRPWIAVKSMYLEGELTVDSPVLSLSTTLYNSGATPANNVLIHHYYLLSEHDFPEEPSYCGGTASPIPITICAHDMRTVRVWMPLADGEVDRFTDGQNLYVFGVILYADGFGNKHQTRWSGRYEDGVGIDSHFSLTGRHEYID